MGKFKYSMQNILDIKIKLETQAKNEFSEANRAYLIEKEKLEELFKKRAVYEAALKEQLSGSLNISEINICKKNINSLKSAIRTQLMNVKKAEDMLEVKRVALNMEYTSLIFPGDKIDIFASGLSDNSTSYKSSFSDKLTDSMWEITMPVDSGRVVLFQLGTQFDFIIYTQNKTILKSSAIVRQRYRKENMYFLAIELINNLEKIQRRQFFRLPCTIDMDFYEVRYDDKAESELEFCKKMYKNHAINSKNMNTVKSVILDISGGGIRFSLSTPLEEGTYFMAQFSLALEECTQQFNIVCKVINCTQSLDYADRYFARSKFIFDRMTEREKIVRFVFEEERRIRRREME